jgi:hypothetical protein
MFNQDTVAQMAPQITPKLLSLFMSEHSEGNLGAELINLFKHWCNFEACRSIFVESLVPFAIEIVHNYFKNTANEDNKDKQLTICNISESLSSSIDSSNEKTKKIESQQESQVNNVVDAAIMHHVLDFLCILLKKTDKNRSPQEFKRIIGVFPQLLHFVHKSDDMFLLLNGTTTLKNFIFNGAEEIMEICETEKIIEVAKKLLQPTTNEQAALCLGNLVI